jgi:hypothetical protein
VEKSVGWSLFELKIGKLPLNRLICNSFLIESREKQEADVGRKIAMSRPRCDENSDSTEVAVNCSELMES